ncbi:MAG TPA: FAD-binding oxidoreductase [Tepidisphaeraceae bacterium]|nr:FAD-binding oxidoreductase [Tepidisphaeraceae bacterium]
MDLRGGDSYWTSVDPVFPAEPAPSGDLQSDVAIVGAGVSGAFAAYYLARAGQKVIVVDRRPPARGSTAACTALLQYELDHPLTDIAKKHGFDHAAAAYSTCVDSLDWLQQIVKSLDDDCDLQARPTLLVPRGKSDIDEMRAELNARQQIKIATRWIDQDELRDRWKIDRIGAIHSETSLEIDPIRLTHALLRDAIQHGAKVYSPVEVTEYQFSPNKVSLETNSGTIINAARVVIANGYETPKFLRKDYGKLHSTWAAVSAPIDLEKFWPMRQLVWEWGETYLYARTLPSGGIMFGGEDEDFTNPELRDAMIESKTKKLVEKLAKLVPGLDVEVTHAWAGTFASTQDGMPYIGAVEDFTNAYLALGYGGNGVTFSLIAGRAITGLITGDANLSAPAKLFWFDR